MGCKDIAYDEYGFEDLFDLRNVPKPHTLVCVAFLSILKFQDKPHLLRCGNQGEFFDKYVGEINIWWWVQ